MEKKKERKVCGLPCEVYSRVIGYYRPVKMWNLGKAEEFKDRVTYKNDEYKNDEYKNDEGGEK